jgi:hypothetical protein
MRNMAPATLMPPADDAVGAPTRFARLSRPLGTAALVALVACLLLLGANAASGRSTYVPSGLRSFPGWLAGPLAPLGFTTSHAVLEGLVLAICALYAVCLACMRAIPPRRVWAAIIVASLVAALAPPLLSGDALGYLGFARLGALHGLSPYTFTANAAPHDPINPYLTWYGPTAVTTPYGPLFTLASYLLVPLGIAAGLWALKAIAALTSLATTVLIWRIAKRLRTAPKWAVAVYGLNPVVLVFAIGGAHNDTWFGLLVAGGILLAVRGRERGAGTAMVAATALKVSALMIVPFALIASADRRRFAYWTLGMLVVASAAALVIFGFSLDGIGRALLDEQRTVARHALPNEVSMLLGFAHLPEAIRAAFIAGFAVCGLAALWCAWRGSPWLDCYAWATLALLAATSWLLPWYALWVLLPACVSSSRRLQGAALVASAYCVAIKIL